MKGVEVIGLVKNNGQEKPKIFLVIFARFLENLVKSQLNFKGNILKI